ncbi:glycosyltransferase family 4 protein [Aeromicrobium sp. Marseille-Q0843]|uniref:Glycosyltransferase family 4 protein n=1 Tax=Aeromicrobium phoceense TaxID=2754045 RepID=A0A838XSH9_9ACTN|nr:glycosyltransferase family 4 protein [Aeromicrobium phoceense]MBA4609860.1 glycosyltransferase family 4 protein [Aeromicrobium phoceense]
MARILLWHVHGSWTTAFVQGGHEYVLPVDEDRGPDGRGRARTWDWPRSVVERTREELPGIEPDLVVLQRPHEAELVRQWTGRRPGVDLPAVYLEHNTPGGEIPYTRHPMADQDRIPVVHVTHVNRLLWDTGSARTTVIEHGICDPGHRYTGEVPHAAVAMNDPVRRGRAVGVDLLPLLATAAPVDVFGMRTEGVADPALHITAYDDLPQDRMHDELARRRLYVHTARWTSLGLSLIEAMQLGLPVVALAMTEVPTAVPPGTGLVTADLDVLVRHVEALVKDPELAADLGHRGRVHALDRFGLERFLSDWDDVLERALR